LLRNLLAEDIMNTNLSKAAGWFLTVMAFALLIAMRELGLVALLLPLSLALGYVVTRAREHKPGLTDKPEKG
jgi:hypothetical protein